MSVKCVGGVDDERGWRRRVDGDRSWNTVRKNVYGWPAWEVEPLYPYTQTCFASLLHGNKDEYFVYACVLGRRLFESSDGSDRVLLCGPGCCEEYSKRMALREAGWNRLLAVDVIATLSYLNAAPL